MDTQTTISSGILESYVLGLTSEAENIQVQQWMKDFQEIADEIRMIELNIERYAMAHEVAPSENIKEKIMSGIRPPQNAPVIPYNQSIKKNERSAVINFSFWKKMAAASIVLLFLSSIVNLVYYNKYESASREAKKNEELYAQQLNENSELKQSVSIVQDKYARAVSLEGLPAAPDAAAKIFWMKNTGDVYVDPSNLPVAPAGKQYQLWAIVDGKPVNAGMIVTTKKGNEFRIQKMRSFGKAEAFAITLENKGGNPTPQGEMYVLGKL